MLLLFAVSLLWAFSPGLIKHFLGDLPSAAVATVRLGLTFALAAPFLRFGLVAKSTAAWLAGIGALQFGVMYLFYLSAFRFLQGHEVFLFTILTPLYLVLFDSALSNRLRPRHALAALLSAVGAGVIIPRGVGTPNVMIGFLLVQGANLCFAIGQVAYQRTRPALPHLSEPYVFAWLALGAFVATTTVAIPLTNWSAFTPTSEQWRVLAFLGLGASGAGFFLWNFALTRVNPGTLAAFNNAKIPLGVAISLLVFQEPTDLTRLLISLALLAGGVWIAESDPEKAGPPTRDAKQSAPQTTKP